jgi:hypothetical protein
LDVLLIDKKRSDESKTTFKKPCGGLIAPDAQRALARFQLQIPTEVLANPQILLSRRSTFNSNLSLIINDSILTSIVIGLTVGYYR